MEKRDFLAATLGIGAICPTLLTATPEEKRDAAGLAKKASLFHIEPYLQNISETEATVTWLTQTKCHSWVEWGKSEALGNRAQSVVDGQITANNTLNKITITGLEPAQTYFYRICSREIIQYNPYRVEWGVTDISPIQSFSTAHTTSDSLTCIFFNDLHNCLPVFNLLTQHVESLDYDMSVFNGDCFNDPRKENQVLDLLESYNRGIHASEKPVVYLRGNHEIRGAYSRQWPALMSNPGGKQYFTMNRGPIYFVFMDCGEDKLDNHWAYSGLNDFEGFHREQAAWLEKEIEKPAFKKAPYRVLVHHIPIYGLNSESYNPWKTLWGPILNRAGFDLSLHGHTHEATIHPPMTAGKHSYPVIIGGGPTEENGTVTVLKANDIELSVSILNTQGQRVGRYQVQRKCQKGIRI